VTRSTAKTLLILATVVLGGAAGAQQGPPNALQGFSGNRGKPVTIRAASLEVRDKQKFATFNGDVHVVQGDTDMRCKVLVVFYEDSSTQQSGGAAQANAAQAAAPGALGGNSQIRRMEAKGGVVVTQKDQVATGDRGDFDMRANTVTLTGNVVVTKGQDVLRGQKLVVNLTDGVSKMDAAGAGQPIEMMFTPRQDSKSGPGQSPAPAQGQNPTQSPAKSARPTRPN
jgi:lipopolysaccharide export system protein LptA